MGAAGEIERTMESVKNLIAGYQTHAGGLIAAHILITTCVTGG